MTNKERILKSIKFIESNLKSEISVLDIAWDSCYSLYHFIRLFQSITGISPNKYLLQRRLSVAAYELRDTTKKISDIGFDYQFGSHESFTRAFRKCFGINPSKIREGYPLTSISIFERISEDYIYQSDKARNQPPEIIELNKKIIVGTSFFIKDNAKISDLSSEWSLFMSEIGNIKNKVVPEKLYQIQYWYENQDLGGMYFFIGAEVENTADVNPQFVIKTIPKGSYLRFIHKGLANKVGYTYKYIYNQYLPETDYKLTKSFNFEFYGEKCLGPNNENSESEIYVPVEV